MELAFGASVATTVAGTAMGMQAQDDAAQSALDRAYYDKEMSEYNAERIRERSKSESSKIIAEGKRLRGAQVVQQAASGVVLGEGSAQSIVDQTTDLSHQDALVTLYNGIEGQLEQREAGRHALAQGHDKAEAAGKAKMATLISGIGQVAGNYHTYKSLSTP